MALRRGKWTEKEERYADALIDAFKQGILEDVKEGCTLRTMMSVKLRCSPMRISKKYAKECIGKMVYCKRSHPRAVAKHCAAILNRMDQELQAALANDRPAKLLPGHSQIFPGPCVSNVTFSGSTPPQRPAAVKLNVLLPDSSSLANPDMSSVGRGLKRRNDETGPTVLRAVPPKMPRKSLNGATSTSEAGGPAAVPEPRSANKGCPPPALDDDSWLDSTWDDIIAFSNSNGMDDECPFDPEFTHEDPMAFGMCIEGL